MYKAVISGIGSYVPEQRLSNRDLEQMVDTSDEWIITRTGISERRIAASWQATSDLAFQAAAAALKDANLSPEDIDLLVVATVTPDHIFPSVACQLQHRLGCRNVGAFDVGATCVGFISALNIAEQFLKNGRHQHILVVGADTLSRITDYTDRSTCILFADGAGAWVVSRSEISDEKGIIHSSIHSAGEHFERLYVPEGGSRHPAGKETKAKIVMEGNKIFKLAVNAMSQTVQETMETTGYTAEDIDWLIPHQANQRILEAVAKNLDFDQEKVINTIKYYGNNSSATIPLAMDTAVKDGRIRRGDTIMLTAFGGGLVWGSLLFEY
ncbi:beta-ketoacyl-ACP synthase III [Effusibacillus consociatus]|uniref:Beta-ketoacyl-[acyl-carrier-protein] synthase III n=1 Tax=Effusibacillus consociatus TaxID=1117041 RepID=A0ABV9Q4I0_9BACL